MQELWEMWVWSLGSEDPLGEDMATHSSIAWRILWTEEPGELQFMETQRSTTEGTKHAMTQKPY